MIAQFLISQRFKVAALALLAVLAMGLRPAAAQGDKPSLPDPVKFINKFVCLGASLARLEARLTLSRALERMGDFEIDEAGLRRVRSSTVRGVKALPLEFTPSARVSPSNSIGPRTFAR